MMLKTNIEIIEAGLHTGLTSILLAKAITESYAPNTEVFFVTTSKEQKKIVTKRTVKFLDIPKGHILQNINFITVKQFNKMMKCDGPQSQRMDVVLVLDTQQCKSDLTTLYQNFSKVIIGKGVGLF